MQIVNAFETLRVTYENLEMMLLPGQTEPEPTHTSPMDAVIGRLEAENEYVRRLHTRLASDLREFPEDEQREDLAPETLG
jgi:hypothetical protein